MGRTFEDHEAKRARVPLMLGLMGASSSGKTYSALRLATGIQRVTGGDVFVVDTESNRALHYADKFRFRHVPFVAPFGPLDYLAAIEHCASRGAKVVVVDSMSHEHEGPGGVLEQHEEEVRRIAKLWGVKESKAQMPAWSKPKAERRRMINTIMQLPVSTIFCFRAKEKLKIQPGKDPIPMGFMPIAGEEFVFEMTVNCLLLPKSGGVPTWQSDEIGERMMMKLPGQFASVFADRAPLSEDIGEALAQWAEGGELSPCAELAAAIEAAGDAHELEALAVKLKAAKLNRAELAGLRAAYARRREELTPRAEPEHAPRTREPGEEG